MFCFTFALAQDGSKASLKERLLEYCRGQFTPVNETPKPTRQKTSTVKSPPSNVKESLASETIDGMDQKSYQPILRPWQTRTHCCGHSVAHDVSWVAKTGVHL